MNHKYTLCCNAGRLFTPGRHFLIMNRWIIPPVESSLVILCHGIMSEDEYNTYRNQERIMIYQNLAFSWIGLYPFHESKRQIGTQYSGDLIKQSEVEWSGYLNVK